MTEQLDHSTITPCTTRLIALCFSPAFTPSLLLPALSFAQQAQDAGRLLEQTRPAQPAPQPGWAVVSQPAAAPALPADATPVEVSRFAFEGNQAISSQALAKLMKDQTGATVPFGQLRNALSRINAAYAAQDIGEGIALRLAPLEHGLLLISERLGGETMPAIRPILLKTQVHGCFQPLQTQARSRNIKSSGLPPCQLVSPTATRCRASASPCHISPVKTGASARSWREV